MTPTLGGSLFCYNAVDYDYPVAAALDSLCAVCDDVIVSDCESTDDTFDILREVAQKYANLRIICGGHWEVGIKSDRLRIHADYAMSFLRTRHHFMLQADEVIHERSFPLIRQLVAEAKHKSWAVTRYNLFGDLEHCLRLDLPNDIKPMSDRVVRMAAREFTSYGDAESLRVDPETCAESDIVIYHYGLVRRDAEHLNKIVDMQTWFHGADGVDQRVLAMQKDAAPYRWWEMHPPENLMPLPYPHPVFSQRWAAERQVEKMAAGIDVRSRDKPTR